MRWQVNVLNPKSITMGQLYGEFDQMTHEWTDGILSTLIRQGVAASDPDKRWYVFEFDLFLSILLCCNETCFI